MRWPCTCATTITQQCSRSTSAHLHAPEPRGGGRASPLLPWTPPLPPLVSRVVPIANPRASWIVQAVRSLRCVTFQLSFSPLDRGEKTFQLSCRFYVPEGPELLKTREMHTLCCCAQGTTETCIAIMCAQLFPGNITNYSIIASRKCHDTTWGSTFRLNHPTPPFNC